MTPTTPFIPASPGPTEAAWTYRATMVAVVDGDTFDVILDFGIGLKQPHRLRMGGIDAPEIKLYAGVTPEEKERGIYIRDYLRERLTPGTRVIVKTEIEPGGEDRRDQWSRYISHIWHEGEYLNNVVKLLNADLIERQRASVLPAFKVGQ